MWRERKILFIKMRFTTRNVLEISKIQNHGENIRSICTQKFFVRTIPINLFRVPKVLEVLLEQQWRHRHLNRLGIPEWMRKGEGQKLTRSRTSSKRAGGRAIERISKRTNERTAILLPQNADCKESPVTFVRCAGMCLTTLAAQFRSEGMHYRGDLPLTPTQVQILFVREFWPDPVAHHLPPSASAEIFSKDVPRSPDKRQTPKNALLTTGHKLHFFHTKKKIVI